MAKPTEVISWATDAAFASDGDAWGGDANKVDPGATRRAEGIEPDTFPAEWLNYHLNAVGKHLTYLHTVNEATIELHALGAFRVVPLGGSGLVDASAGIVGAGFNLELADNTVMAVMALNRLVPEGATITGIDLLITPGTHSVGGVFGVYAVQPDWTTPAISAHSEMSSDTTSGTSLQVLSPATLPTIGVGTVHYIAYRPVDITAGVDKLHAVRIRFSV